MRLRELREQLQNADAVLGRLGGERGVGGWRRVARKGGRGALKETGKREGEKYRGKREFSLRDESIQGVVITWNIKK